MRLADIRVEGRHRKELGDINSLMRSIEEIGLIAPVVVTRDGRLIAGERRLEACRRLGWASISVVCPGNLTDAASLLKAERDENTCRKDMLPSELAALAEALHGIEAQEARERMAEAGRSAAPGRPAERSDPTVGGFQSGNAHESREAVADALGMGTTNYGELRNAYTLANDEAAPAEERELAQQALDQMDQTGSIRSAGKNLRDQLKELRSDDSSTDPGLVADGTDEWIPDPHDRHRTAVQQRRRIALRLNAEGWTSPQIADHLGITRRAAWAILHKASARRPRMRRRLKAATLQNCMLQYQGTTDRLQLEFEDGLDESVTPQMAGDWADELTQIIRPLQHLRKQLKEKSNG